MLVLESQTVTSNDGFFGACDDDDAPPFVGDNLKIYNKKDKLDKERVPVWSKENFKVESINHSMGQDFYNLDQEN